MLASSKAEENKILPSVKNLHPSSDKHAGLLQDGWAPDENAEVLF